ncbi:threo-3-hydroxy-L-aspartate ammonia-lyase [Polaromonas sp.]|uniref:threo-3-hydroxy-L-aspartate ammonia-lyase n=1 Tax=Polaromonas sp. TaxID=1869339 RepID=UPI002FC6D4B4
MLLPTSADIAAAARRLQGHAAKTPVLTSRTANELHNAEVFFKCENFQRVGAFKFRGAFNALSQFNEYQRKRGAIAFSTGNHAQAIALSARILGMPAVIVMPSDAPAPKVAATKGYGGEVHFYDRFKDDREQISRRLIEERGLTLVPPFDHFDVIAGQGTAALELFAEVGGLDFLLVPLGGGGLLSGSLLAAKGMCPSCLVYGVEPEAGNDGQQSVRSGVLTSIPTPRTIADGAQTQRLGVHNFEIIRNSVAGVITVPDADLVSAMRFFAERMKLIVEPTGCLGFAGIRHLDVPIKNKRVGVILTGGNIDMTHFSQWFGA